MIHQGNMFLSELYKLLSCSDDVVLNISLKLPVDICTYFSTVRDGSSAATHHASHTKTTHSRLGHLWASEIALNHL